MPRKKIPTEQELELIIQMNNQHYSYKEIGQAIDCGYETIKRIMNDYNIIKKQTTRINHKLKEDFFENIQTEEQAYILGLLKTDGYIKEKQGRTPCWGISLKESDKYILEQILSLINSDAKLSKDKRIGKECFSFEISNKKMCFDLEKFNIIKNKTYLLENINLEQIPENLQRHYLRGLLDGDGSVYIETKYNQLAICFTGYNKEFVASFQKAIDSHLKRDKNNKIQKSNAYFCRWKGNKICFQILDFLYRDSKIFLKRKKDFYLNFINK